MAQGRLDGRRPDRTLPPVRGRRLRPGALTGVTAILFLKGPFDIFLPVVHLWELVIKDPLTNLLVFLYAHLLTVPVIATIGAYGVSIIILTILVRLILAPLQQFQLVTQRKTMTEQRKLSPQVAELRKKYKNDRNRLNTETMKLYQEHGVNPLGGFIGCLPLLVQIPVLTALYWVFTGFARSHPNVVTHFLFVPNLNENPLHHVLVLLVGLPVPQPVYLIFPLLAALTTLVQSKMLQMPPPPNPTEQEAQAAQMQRTMVWLSPLMIGWFSLQVPAGLGLYWFIGNCVSIIQQSFVVGWGNLLPARFRAVAGGAPATPPGKGSTGGRPKGGPPPRDPPRKNGPASKKPKR